MKIGDVFISNNCGEAIVIDLIDRSNAKVKFKNTGFECVYQRSHIRRGAIKDPFYPSVYGVGYIGVGVHVASKSKIQSKAYKSWVRMLERCYSDFYKNNRETYKNCIVTAEWHNFQNFCEWFLKNYIDGFQLDKDLSFLGNEIYSKETCFFVPGWLNNIMSRCTMRGVNKQLGSTKRQYRHVSQISVNGKNLTIGSYRDAVSARRAYLLKKADLLKSVNLNNDKFYELKICLASTASKMAIISRAKNINKKYDFFEINGLDSKREMV